VGDDLERLEGLLRDAVLADPVVAARPMADLFEAGGKRIRPALLLLCARLGRYDFDAVAPAALAVELIHAATLVHDDVIDRSETRRGRPTVMATQGESAAIVVGDFYFAKAHREASRTGSPLVVDLLAGAVMRVCHGELQQQHARYQYRISLERYLRRIQLKTAALLAAACAVGAVLGDLDSGQRVRLTRYGSRLGMAFQMADDVLDYTSSEAKLGKPVGQDLLEGHATLPLLLAYDLPGGDEVKAMLAEGGAPDPETVARVVELVRRSGAPEVALARARETAAEARWELAGLPEGPARDTLDALAEYVVARNA
jgi:geranylgeranyl pyrophosphate synthase